MEADNVLRQAVQTITDLVGYNAIINLDFADIKSVMSCQGAALIGVGTPQVCDPRSRGIQAPEGTGETGTGTWH